MKETKSIGGIKETLITDHIPIQKERPILFSGEMVRAILDGHKTQTRRLMASKYFKLEMCQLSEPPHLRYCEFNYQRGVGLYESGSGPFDVSDFSEGGSQWHAATFCRYGLAGDQLWVRETFAETDSDGGPVITYRAGGYLINGATGSKRAGTFKNEVFAGEAGNVYPPDKWRPSIFMPRWASRITLEITNVRVERLQEITNSDCRAEGIRCASRDNKNPMRRGQRDAYHLLWDSLHGKGAWDKNPWVWVISFCRVDFVREHIEKVFSDQPGCEITIREVEP